MKRWMWTGAVAAFIVAAVVAFAPAPASSQANVDIYFEQGGAKMVVDSPGEIEIQTGGTLDVQSGATATLAGTNTLSGATTISGALTVSGAMTVSADQTIGAGKVLSIASGGTLNVASGGTAQVPTGGTLNVSGTHTIQAAGVLNVASGGTLNVASGGTGQYPTGSTLNVSGTQTLQSGGVLTAATGSTVNVTGTGAIWGITSVKQGGALVLDPGAKVVYNVQSKAANYTVLASESGTTFVATAADVEFILPATVAGLRYTFIFKAPSGGTGGQVSPVAADKIMGDGFTSADDKAAINSGATDREGDAITVEGDGVDGWFIVSKSGTWAREG